MNGIVVDLRYSDRNGRFDASVDGDRLFPVDIRIVRQLLDEVVQRAVVAVHT